MRVIELEPPRVAEAAAVLARSMLDEPMGRYLLPDDEEFLSVNRPICDATIRAAIEGGRADGWGEPVVGVAVWLHRPELPSDERLAESSQTQPDSGYPAHAQERLHRVLSVLEQLRQRVHSHEHVYLDSVGVLPDHRTQGIASSLLDAGHDWADRHGLPCLLDTFAEANVSFYRRRGYEIVARVPLPESNLNGTAMQRGPR